LLDLRDASQGDVSVVLEDGRPIPLYREDLQRGAKNQDAAGVGYFHDLAAVQMQPQGHKWTLHEKLPELIGRQTEECMPTRNGRQR
jgi:hypothetical protein